MYIDIHSHQKSKSPISLVDGIHFKGIHPWYIDPLTYLADFQKLAANIRENRPLMIGETGIDRLKTKTSFGIQEEVFQMHIDLALKYNLPMVIHCLRAHSDLLHILKVCKSFPRSIIHDFSGTEIELKQYLKYDIYFSFGRTLCIPNSKAQIVFKNAPIDRVFFETDDSRDHSIEMIYSKAIELSGNKLLEKQIENNFLKFFNYSHDLSPTDFIKKLTSISV